MKLSQLLSQVEIEESNIKDDIDLTGIVYDSRKVIPGCVFVAVKGYKTDGHKYIKQSIDNGAIAVIIQDETEKNIPYIRVKDTRKALALMSSAWFENPSSRFKLIGVTGTNGKTTTTYLIKNILEEAGHKVGLIGTNQNMIGQKVLEALHTTPESYELQELFYQMAQEGVSHVVMEVSSHALYLNRVAGSEFEIGIFTNLTQDHLDFHKTMEEYLSAKEILFGMCKKGIINLDDEAAQHIVENAACEIMTYSIDKNAADIIAKNVRLKATGIEFELLYGDKLTRIELKIPGRFSVYNALSAIGACLEMGISADTITAALKKSKGVMGRIEVVDTNTDYTVLIDYAHTPDGLYNILSAVAGFAKGRIIAVFGCGGDRDKTKRPKMGKIAGGMSNICVVTSDNPRTENPASIIEDILVGMEDTAAKRVIIENRKEAIAWALHNAKPDDVVVLAGKGHETYQILKDKTIHFDEREVIAEILAEGKK
jgi:UDP-N-acetylmuramoyl-L-alanyl-D-glutamate--2,6-diaminopimelate ligase